MTQEQESVEKPTDDRIAILLAIRKSHKQNLKGNWNNMGATILNPDS